MWSDVDTTSSSILEIFLPADEMVIKRPITDEQGDTIGYQVFHFQNYYANYLIKCCLLLTMLSNILEYLHRTID